MSNWLKSFGSKCAGMLASALLVIPSLVIGMKDVSYAQQDTSTVDEKQNIIGNTLYHSFELLIFSLCSVFISCSIVPPIHQFLDTCSWRNDKPVYKRIFDMSYLLAFLSHRAIVVAVSIEGIILCSGDEATIETVQEFLAESGIALLAGSGACIATGTLSLGERIQGQCFPTTEEEQYGLLS